MRTLPDHSTTIVRTEEGDGEITWTPPLQPDDPHTMRARIRLGTGRHLDGIRTLAVVDGTWCDRGVAPSISDESWHPELPDGIGEQIALTRLVMAEIPNCSKVLMLPEVQLGSKGFEIGSGAIFYQKSDRGFQGIVPEHLLDQVPFVRAVERVAGSFAEWFGATAHDDGSGIAGDLSIDVSPTGLSVVFDDENDGGVLTLRSELVDGAWSHTTTFRIPIYEDAVGTLRAIADPRPYVSDFASESETWKDIVKSDPEATAKIEDKAVMLDVRPGTLLKDRD